MTLAAPSPLLSPRLRSRNETPYEPLLASRLMPRRRSFLFFSMNLSEGDPPFSPGVTPPSLIPHRDSTYTGLLRPPPICLSPGMPPTFSLLKTTEAFSSLLFASSRKGNFFTQCSPGIPPYKSATTFSLFSAMVSNSPLFGLVLRRSSPNS